MQEVVKTPSISTRKRRYKTLFKFSTMKQLESAREYKKMLRSENSAGNITKAAKVSKRALKLSETISESDEQDGLQTPMPFIEFGVFKGAKPKDVEEEVDLRRSDQVKVMLEFSYCIGHR
jgi:hypothetical protein